MMLTQELFNPSNGNAFNLKTSKRIKILLRVVDVPTNFTAFFLHPLLKKKIKPFRIQNLLLCFVVEPEELVATWIWGLSCAPLRESLS